MSALLAANSARRHRSVVQAQAERPTRFDTLHAMKTRTQPTRDARERARESKPSRETSPKRTQKPGEVGLANEVRPGLGTRTKTKSSNAPVVQRKTKTDREPLGRVAPLPPSKRRSSPREQPSDAFARELEHDTGVSGHASGD
jgi:hypothetical protein